MLPLVGRRVRVEAVEWRHLDAIWELVSHPFLRGGWPVSGRSLGRDELLAELWEMSSIYCAIETVHDQRTIGILQGLSERHRDGTVELAVVMDPDLWRAGWPIEAVVLFLDWLFEIRRMRKVYMRAPAAEFEAMAGGFGKRMVEEARLIDHVEVRGVRQDLVICALYAESWAGEHARRVLR